MSRVLGRLCLGACCALAFACDPEPESGAQDGGEPVDSEGPDDAGEPSSCDIQPVTSCPDPAPRFADVQPIFKERCSACHVDNWSGPWPLDTYQHIADWASTIRDMVRTCTMPPPEAGMPLPDEDAEKILTWIACKTPR